MALALLTILLVTAAIVGVLWLRERQALGGPTPVSKTASAKRRPPATDGISADIVRRVVHPDDKHLLEEGARHSLETGEPYLVDFRIVPAKGVTR